MENEKMLWNRRIFAVAACCAFYIFSTVLPLEAGGYGYRTDKTVVGVVMRHVVQPGETLLDIARNYGLGYNEITLPYPDLDPWVPGVGRELSIPTQWVLPPTKKFGIVINIAELRLYYFHRELGIVSTYPVGIGDTGWETPVATAKVISRQENPTWTVPKSLREKYGVVSVPPGPTNPLGKFWLGLSLQGYGIHGTHFPWGVGRLVSHGCIRLYPEHIARLFRDVPMGTPVELVYEPVKVGFYEGGIYLEVHPDIYHRIPDLKEHAKSQLQYMGLWDMIFPQSFQLAVDQRNGVPVRIGVYKNG